MPAYAAGPFFLADDYFRSEAPALALMAQSLVGRTRYLQELVQGRSVPPDAPCTPLNPQGEIGIDHTGGGWGSCFLHPIAWIGGIAPNANIQGARGVAIPPITVDEPQRLHWRHFINRPFASFPDTAHGAPPYSRGIVRLRAHTTGGNSTLRMKLYSNDLPPSEEDTNVGTITTTEGTYDIDADKFFRLIPGLNGVMMRFNGSTSNPIFIDSLAILQIVKRAHT